MPTKTSRAILMAFASALAATAPFASLAQPAHKPRLKPTVSCVAVADLSLLSRIETLYGSFSARWLQLGEHWFQAYELPGEARNPLLPRGDRTGPVRGYTWIQSPRCVAQQDQASAAWHVRIVANRITFNESSGWTKPLPAGVLAEFVITPGDNGWTTIDNTAAVSFRQPEDKEWRPAIADIPPRAANAMAATKTRR